MGKKTKQLTLAFATLLTAGLLGCAPAQSQTPHRESSSQATDSDNSSQSKASRAKEESPAEEALDETGGESQEQEDAEIPSSGTPYHGTDREWEERVRELQRAMQESVPTEEETLQVGPGLQDIAQLIGLKATVELYRSACVVDVDEGENPYDVTWDYGELYDAFVQEVDWSLLFDGDYYIETFPGLAHLYHKDKDLLLRHFQTVGIHEGRQGCQDFNVAAYQKNCGAEVREAFADNYECYYFYYAMNQKTQKEIVSTGSEKKQLTTKLTHMQQTELDNLNEYRAEVGVFPLEYDAELSALACYRAYIDALEDWDAHDWLQAPEKQDEITEMMDMVLTEHWGENTVHGYPRNRDYSFKQGPATAWYIKYRYSEDHYNAIIAEKYCYLGSANCYISDYKKENAEYPNAEAVYVHFDVFVPELTTPTHD